MPIQRQRLVIDTEDAGRGVVKRAPAHEMIDRIAVFESGIYADEGFGPESIAGVERFDLLLDVFCADFCEGSGKSLVICYQCTIEIKYIHDSQPPVSIF